MRAASIHETPPVVFAHSVIRDGVRSAAELTRALDRDPVAAAHYQGFRGSNAQLDHLSQPRLAYVSYRIADAVFWTRKAVTLAEGEAVLTDGENLARARCGNRISFTPKRPVGPDVDMNTPELPPVGDEGNAADGIADVFGLPLIVHNLFPPYFGGDFVGSVGDVGMNGGSDRGYDGSFGGGGSGGVGAGRAPLMVRDSEHNTLVMVDPSGMPAVTIPPVLVTYPKAGQEPRDTAPVSGSYPGPVFVWTGGQSGITLSGFPVVGGHGSSGAGDAPSSPISPPLPPGGSGGTLGGSPGTPTTGGGGTTMANSEDGDVPEPATAVLLAAGVIALLAGRRMLA